MSSVFLSYSHKDEKWKDRLKTHLDGLELDAWDDRRIGAGKAWFEEIQDAMAKASAAVFLISVDFLTSKFIRGEEAPKLLERRAMEGLPVIPVIVRSCNWNQVAWLSSLQALPSDGRPLATRRGNNIDAELARIAREILEIIDRQTKEFETSRHYEFRRPDDFLDRIEEVCRLREPEKTEIRRYPGIGAAGGYLRIARPVGKMLDIFPVGVVEHRISRETFYAFLAEIDAPYRKHDPGMFSVLVYGGPPAPAEVIAEAESRRVHLASLVEYQGLIDFRNHLGKQTAKLAADPVYPPSLYVPQRMRTLSLFGREEDESEDALKLVQEWLASPFGRFLVLLGDFGTGKTFLLQELARRMGEEEGLVPVLLQMRSLEKGRSLDALLAQHFAQEGMEGFSPAKFRYMLEQGRIALLFDGFDELALRVTYSKAADHFATLLQAATGNAKVVLTSRRQHFLSESQVKTALTQQVESLSGHRLAILRSFSREQVRVFLVNFFQGDVVKAEARLDLIDRVKDLLGLSSNPRLLGFIADLPEEQLLGACAEGGEITAAKLYELLLSRWLEFEFDRIHPKGAPPGLSVAERWQAITSLAMRLWQKTERFVNLSDLGEEAARIVRAVGPAVLDSETATFQVGSGTLLVRDDEGNFAFLHQSILEWLVAKSAADGVAAGEAPEALKTREISPLMADFFAGLAGRDRSVAWARAILEARATEAAKKNALLVLERQKESVRKGLDLVGQDLRGQDLSGQDLSGADLSGADLTAARLIGTRLSTARLVRAKMQAADLTAARLNGADLTEADLTGARLVGADLQGAQLTGTVLRRARLLGVDLNADSLEPLDTFGAALDLSELGPQGGAVWECSSVAWSPDGELIATAAGQVVKLWEAQSGREIRALTGHRNLVRSVAFSPDGQSLASGSSDDTVRLWEVSSGREIRALTGHQNGVLSVAFSPDGQSFASSSDDKTVRLWEVLSGREIRAFQGHKRGVLSVAFSPDSQSLASGSDDNTIRLWEVPSGREIHAFNGHQAGVRSVAFNPAGQSLATGSDDKTVRLWEVSSGREIRALNGHQTGVRSVAFNPAGQSLASGSDDKIVRLWEVSSGREIRAFKGHYDAVRSVAFSPDGQSLASGSFDKIVRLWEVSSGREIRAFKGHSDEVRSVAFSPDGQSLASGSFDKIVRLWEVSSGHEICAFQGHLYGVLSVAFSPDGQSLASGSYDQTVRLWEVSSGREIDAFKGHQNVVLSVAFSPDGQSLASGSYDQTVRLWGVESGRKMDAFKGHQSAVLSVAFSPDGQILASGSEDKTVRLWQAESGREIRTLKGHKNGVLSVAFSPDGQSLASGSSDQTVHLWEVSSGRPIRTFKGHQTVVQSVAFSPDGQSLASGSSDGTIRLWRIADGRCLAVLLPLPEGWVAYSPDGRYKLGGVPAGGFWHAANLCRFEIGELDEWVPGLRLADDASFFDLPPWKPKVRVPERFARGRQAG